MMQDRELKAKLVEALRSDRYKQATGRMRLHDGYCCLGVLCAVAGKEVPNDTMTVVGISPDNNPVDKLYAFAREQLGGFSHYTEMMRMNDEGMTFAKIADYVEKHL